ncbi:splicing factor C9orf78 homolog [Oppia nitens]|uniref:splicing factor C9orf78 homolog n=1 Tax=Oppia nitens TaxID=1686743 RepID=UPI0023DBBF02|nr:splicing factor C9orf78 homolog [Oppia nitens]
MSDDSELKSEDNNNKIVFKKKTRRFAQRKRDVNEDNDEDVQQEADNNSDEWKILSELKRTQMSRKRCNKGIDIIELTQNPNISKSKNETQSGVTGGLSDAKTLTNELDLGNTFSVETNRRDEDTDLMKYIDEELSRRKGVNKSDSSTVDKKTMTATTNDINTLFDVLPDHLIKNTSKKSEEMLSNQMLNGIPEIELGLDEKIRNIEATEEAKIQLLNNRRNKNNANSSSFVPNNIAVCFAQHNRYNIREDIPRLTNAPKRPRIDTQPTNQYVEEPVVVIGDEPKQVMRQTRNWDHNSNKFYGKDKATDDYIFEKFRKQFRKY